MRTVIVTVRDGSIQDVQVPSDCEVIVRDYDDINVTAGFCQTDQEAEVFTEYIYTADESEPAEAA